jgi:glycosyltransferase involved in cell wall biosynthesis
MKILVVLPFAFFRSSGSPLNSFYRVQALLKLGHTIDIATYPHGENICCEKLRIYRFPKRKLFRSIQPGDLLKKIVYDFLLFFNFFYRVIRNRYDVIIAHGTITLFTIVLKPFIKARFVSTIHGNIEEELSKWNISNSRKLFNFISKLEVFPLKFYDKIITVTDNLKERLVEKGIDSSLIVVITNSTFSKKLSGFTKSDGKIIILYTGTFVEVQNLELIYRTAAILKDEKIEFVLIGVTDSEILSHNDLIKKYGIKKCVRLYRRKQPHELEGFYKKATIVVSPRIYGKNEIPMKIYDYMNHGKCILVTDVPIHRNILNEDIAFFAKADPRSFADAILYLKAHPDLVEELSRKAKEYFEKNYSFDIMKAKYKKLFLSFTFL